jgi:hypothetical protein
MCTGTLVVESTARCLHSNRGNKTRYTNELGEETPKNRVKYTHTHTHQTPTWCRIRTPSLRQTPQTDTPHLSQIPKHRPVTAHLNHTAEARIKKKKNIQTKYNNKNEDIGRRKEKGREQKKQEEEEEKKRKKNRRTCCIHWCACLSRSNNPYLHTESQVG